MNWSKITPASIILIEALINRWVPGSTSHIITYKLLDRFISFVYTRDNRIQTKALKGRSIPGNRCDREGDSPAERFPQRDSRGCREEGRPGASGLNAIVIRFGRLVFR
jgi:hypothetical protein